MMKILWRLERALAASTAFHFAFTIGVFNLLADMTYEAGGSVTVRSLGRLV